jgi:hypothetical protein
MSYKETLMLGAAGAVAIYVARKIPSVKAVFDKGANNNGKMVPGVPEIALRNGWSAAWIAIPAAAAFYLSR